MSNGGELRRTFLKALETKEIPEDVSLPVIMAGQIELYGFLKIVKDQSDSNGKKIIVLSIVVALLAVLVGKELGLPLPVIIP